MPSWVESPAESSNPANFLDGIKPDSSLRLPGSTRQDARFCPAIAVSLIEAGMAVSSLTDAAREKKTISYGTNRLFHMAVEVWGVQVV